VAVKAEKLAELKKEINFKWKVQTSNEHNAICVAYVDARDVFDLLDEVVGPENWSTDFQVIKDQLFCRMGIYVEYPDGSKSWVYKMDTGSEGSFEVEKTLVSDSVKRSSVQHGIGRFLYSMDIQKLRTKKHTNGKFYPVDDKGEILWDSADLTDYINNTIERKKHPPAQGRLNLRQPDPGESEEKKDKPGYKKSDGQPTYTNSQWSKATMDKAAKVEKDGKKGSECLTMFISKYNTSKKTDYKEITDFNSDEKLLSLINFVENAIPEGM
jgi:hypothetical protein